MCGRYSLTTTTDAMRGLFEFENLPNLPPRYNIAPTQQVPVVRAGRARVRELTLMRWGLIPRWAKDASMAAKMINARAETIAEKPSYRDAYQERRCLVPADGFYEWRREGEIKQPFRIGMKGGAPFAFAGLWECWTATETALWFTEGEVIETVTIITTVANDKLRPIHPRMPVILPNDAFDNWLDAANDADTVQPLLKSYPVEPMVYYRVGQTVNNSRTDSPLCIEPLNKGSGGVKAE